MTGIAFVAIFDITGHVTLSSLSYIIPDLAFRQKHGSIVKNPIRRATPMCEFVEQTLILTKLLPNTLYSGVLLRMPSGKVRFEPFRCLTDTKSGKIIPSERIFDRSGLATFAWQYWRISKFEPLAGRPIKTIIGTREQIWEEKLSLEARSVTAIAA